MPWLWLNFYAKPCAICLVEEKIHKDKKFKSVKIMGTKNLRSMFDLLQLKVAKLREDNCEYSIRVQEYDDEDNTRFILALITPLMKRAHRLYKYLLLNLTIVYFTFLDITGTILLLFSNLFFIKFVERSRFILIYNLYYVCKNCASFYR